jgi:hypothetical protein
MTSQQPYSTPPNGGGASSYRQQLHHQSSPQPGYPGSARGNPRPSPISSAPRGTLLTPEEIKKEMGKKKMTAVLLILFLIVISVTLISVNARGSSRKPTHTFDDKSEELELELPEFSGDEAALTEKTRQKYFDPDVARDISEFLQGLGYYDENSYVFIILTFRLWADITDIDFYNAFVKKDFTAICRIAFMRDALNFKYKKVYDQYPYEKLKFPTDELSLENFEKINPVFLAFLKPEIGKIIDKYRRIFILKEFDGYPLDDIPILNKYFHVFKEFPPKDLKHIDIAGPALFADKLSIEQFDSLQRIHHSRLPRDMVEPAARLVAMHAWKGFTYDEKLSKNFDRARTERDQEEELSVITKEKQDIENEEKENEDKKDQTQKKIDTNKASLIKLKEDLANIEVDENLAQEKKKQNLEQVAINDAKHTKLMEDLAKETDEEKKKQIQEEAEVLKAARAKIIEEVEITADKREKIKEEKKQILKKIQIIEAEDPKLVKELARIEEAGEKIKKRKLPILTRFKKRKAEYTEVMGKFEDEDEEKMNELKIELFDIYFDFITADGTLLQILLRDNALIELRPEFMDLFNHNIVTYLKEMARHKMFGSNLIEFFFDPLQSKFDDLLRYTEVPLYLSRKFFDDLLSETISDRDTFNYVYHLKMFGLIEIFKPSIVKKINEALYYRKPFDVPFPLDGKVSSNIPLSICDKKPENK